MPILAWLRPLSVVVPTKTVNGAATLRNNSALLGATGTVTPVVPLPVLTKVGHPSPRLEVDFVHDPAYTGTPTWTDLTSRIVEFSSHRGRQAELDTIEAGTAEIVLNNRDGALDPTYTSSPYYPNVIPMRRARLQVEHSYDTVRKSLFVGYIEAIDPDYSAGWGNVPLVRITLIDIFEILNNIQFGAANLEMEGLTPEGGVPSVLLGTGTWPSVRPTERSDQRINWILDQAGVPSAQRNIQQGNVIVPAKAYENVNALESIKEVVQAEQGLFFSDANGNVVFQARINRINNQKIDIHTLGNAGGFEIPYEDVGFDYDKSRVFNHASISLSQDLDANTAINTVEFLMGKDVSLNTPAQIASDATSQTKYLKRTAPDSSLFVLDANQALGVAQYRIANYKDPRMRPRNVTPITTITDAAQDAGISREISDRIKIVHRDPKTNRTMNVSCYIESVSHRMGQDRKWQTTWDVSPLGTLEGLGFWILGTSTLGGTARLFY